MYLFSKKDKTFKVFNSVNTLSDRIVMICRFIWTIGLEIQNILVLLRTPFYKNQQISAEAWCS